MWAQNSMIKYDDKSISKDFSKQLHRLNNIDISNLEQTVNAGIDQITYSSWILANKKGSVLISEKSTPFSNLSMENTVLSLLVIPEEYHRTYKVKMSKGSIFHYIKKIKHIYENTIS